jgi:hypothetical protein
LHEDRIEPGRHDGAGKDPQRRAWPDLAFGPVAGGDARADRQAGLAVRGKVGVADRSTAALSCGGAPVRAVTSSRSTRPKA